MPLLYPCHARGSKPRVEAIGVPPITTFLPAIVSTSTRMHGEFLRLLFLHAPRETEAQITATGMPSQRSNSDMFRFKRILPVAEEQSRTRGGQAAALSMNLNVDSWCV